ncbi:hypothetical protein [Paenibacillus cookii]|uniref:Uncharacterized protein n=1 Tax=Paenibacillus cookii TaxID=157839 RepID=A0ABQ4LU09_9BACL|nr:hypothetical protein [Paenibacillus cookii]GIO66438.1 hypothetical protein J21TS3_12590 [Paenibacillus cookii]
MPAPDKDDLPIHSEHFHFVINRDHAVYFEENLYLDSEETYPSFRLFGDSRLYGKSIRLLDQR